MMTGHNGEDLIIPVPSGTLIRRKCGHLIADMTHQKEYLFLEGGRGGKGNTFYKSSINQAPQKAQKGESGHQTEVHLELKLLADVGLIGMPNAGKSTLISRISAAKPKIANYHFTTLVPNLGLVRYGDMRTYVVADIPGLIQGAHQGVGLGIQFLKHIERTRVLIHIIDGSEMAFTEPFQAYKAINKELEEYSHTQSSDFTPLTARPQIVVINKADAISEAKRQELQEQFSSETPIHFVSAVTGENIQSLIYLMGDMVFEAHPQ